MAFNSRHDESTLIADYFLTLPRRGTMIDVGAHFGTSFRNYLADGWRIIAIEPDPSKHEKLSRFQADPRFTLLTAAVSDAERDAAAFYASDESTGISSLLPFRGSHREIARVPVTTLRRIIEPMNLDRIDYLKIDTEGMDYKVLLGFPWERLTPEVLLCEFDELKTRGEAHDFRSSGDLLLERGYAVYLSEWHPIVRYGGDHQWRSLRRYPCDLVDPAAWGNFIAVHGHSSVSEFDRLAAAHLST